MQNSKVWQGVKKVYAQYDRLMEKQGFYIVLAICVLVIVISAFYTFKLRDDIDDLPSAAPTRDTQSVAGMEGNQTLSEAQALIKSQGAGQPLSVPTQSAFVLTQPVNGFTGRTFSDTQPQYFAQITAWQIHLGIDLESDYGAIVAACASGTVRSVLTDNEKGLSIQIDHGNGYKSLYCGLSDASYVKAGDPVMQGQTIGHVGNGVLAESDAAPHLHFEIWRNDKPVDPLSVFLGIDTSNTM
ncbi:MAG: peptidoglycan DD-metalloendopeptidase family protein [Clostridiales bacterium]|nr:peptidoglycan DD-metalloendopeptidase family protein [Clostridiales bacterium]